MKDFLANIKYSRGTGTVLDSRSSTYIMRWTRTQQQDECTVYIYIYIYIYNIYKFISPSLVTLNFFVFSGVFSLSNLNWF
jgi:hypothetical protein